MYMNIGIQSGHVIQWFLLRVTDTALMNCAAENDTNNSTIAQLLSSAL